MNSRQLSAFALAMVLASSCAPGDADERLTPEEADQAVRSESPELADADADDGKTGGVRLLEATDLGPGWDIDYEAFIEDVFHGRCGVVEALGTLRAVESVRLSEGETVAVHYVIEIDDAVGRAEHVDDLVSTCQEEGIVSLRAASLNLDDLPPTSAYRVTEKVEMLSVEYVHGHRAWSVTVVDEGRLSLLGVFVLDFDGPSEIEPLEVLETVVASVHTA